MVPSHRPDVRFGLLGASSIAPAAIVEPARRLPGVEVVAVGALRPGAAERFGGRWGIGRTETSYEAVVEDPSIDAVYLSLAASDHARWAIAALEAGKDVLCEKPAAPTAAEAADMAGAARRTGRLLAEAFHYRWHPLFARLGEIVADRAFGGIEGMTSSIIGSRPPAAHPVLHDPALGGGALRHSGCYAVHWMRLLSGEEPRVSGFEQRRGPLGADADSIVDLVFPGGARGRIESSFERDRMPGDPPELVVESASCRLEVHGLIAPQYGHSAVLRRSGAAGRSFTVAGRASYEHQLVAFLAARGDPVAAADLRDDLVAQAGVLEAPYGRTD